MANHEMYTSIRHASFKISLMYPLAASKFPEDLYVKVFTLYEMLRVADIIEDSTIKQLDGKLGKKNISIAEQNTLKKELLDIHIESLYSEKYSDTIEQFITEHAIDKQERSAASYYRMFFDTFVMLPDSTKNIISKTSKAMIPGMIDPKYVDIKTWDDLNKYAGYVAGEVGVGLTQLFAEHIPFNNLESMLVKGYDQGVALQKVNILRDLRSDIESGRNYVPEELLKTQGLTKQDLFKTHRLDTNELFINPNSEKLRKQHKIINVLASNAQSSLSKGLDYALGIPIFEKKNPAFEYSKSVRIFCTSLLLLGQELTYNIFHKPSLTEQSYKPKSLLLKYGLLTPLIWKKNDSIKRLFHNKQIEYYYSNQACY